jgi:short-subunit dehydrogenase
MPFFEDSLEVLTHPYAVTAAYIMAFATLLSFGTYFLPMMMHVFYRPQNLRRKYDAEWALVTGGSSGIGRALCERLAQQGLNLVIAAVDDKLLPKAAEELRAKYANIEVRAVPVNLAKDDGGYMDALREATDDITIQIVVNNAGYICTGFFTERTEGEQLANHTCNATSVVRITHHFLSKLQASGRRGALMFTSSPAGFMPCPFSVIYGSTKMFLTTFGSSLAPEVADEGIDVMVFHPSPVKTNFYTGTHNLDVLEMFKKTGVTPDIIAESMLCGVGRHVVYDQGYYSMAVRTLLKLCDVTALADIITTLAPTLPDYKRMKAALAEKVAGSRRSGAPTSGGKRKRR